MIETQNSKFTISQLKTIVLNTITFLIRNNNLALLKKTARNTKQTAFHHGPSEEEVSDIFFTMYIVL